MKPVDTLLNELGSAARSEVGPDVDVRAHVLETIAEHRLVPRLDIAPLLFGGTAITIAAGVLVAFLPSWQTVFDPWALYFTI